LTLNEILQKLTQLGVNVSVDGNQLRVRAPKHTLTPELRNSLGEYKEELIALLQQRENNRDELALIPISRTEEIHASYAQLRMWLLDKLEPDNPYYNVPITLRLRGKLNHGVLERSLNSIIQRHEALRTTFTERDGQLIQIIKKKFFLPLAIVDLQKFSVPERETEIQHLNREEAQQSFNLSDGPLMRFKLLRLKEYEHILIIVWHHIIADGWSIGIFIKELMIFYRLYSEGQSASLPNLKIQYADFSAWQHQWLQGDFLKQELDFWKNHLQGFEPFLKLPTDRPRQKVRSYQGKTETFSFSKKLSHQLLNISRENEVTLFMTLLTAFKILLYVYTGQKNITVGTPVANRNRKELENLIGYFSNTLALKTDLSGDPSFLNLLERVRRITTTAYAHQDTPFDKVVEALKPKRTLSYSPLFQVLFALQNTPKPKMHLPELTIDVLGMWQTLGTARLDLFFELEETKDGLKCGI